MGFLSNMFGSRGDAYRNYQSRMYGTLGRQSDFATDMMSRYKTLGFNLRGEQEALGEEARSVMLGLYSDMEGDRDSYLTRVNDEFGQTLLSLRADQEAARGSLQGYYDKAYDELATGRDASLELLAQQSRQETARSQQQAAFGGVAGTSFGQQAVGATEAQGTLRQAAMREQYGAQLASQLNMAGQGLAQFDQNAIGQTQAVESARLQSYLGGFESYAQRMQGLRAGAETSRLDLMQQGIASQYGMEQAGLSSYENQYGSYIQQMIGVDQTVNKGLLERDMSDIALGRQLVGAGLSAVTGGMAGGFGSMMSGGGFGSGFSAGLSSYFGGGGFGGAYGAGVSSAAPSAVL